MKNPIQDNRIVKDITFATRFLHFIEDIEINCAAGEDEKEAMISYAEQLVKYQVRTAKDIKEIDYLKRVGVWDKYQETYFVTKDGYTVYLEGSADVDDFLYSCMKEPPTGDQVLTIPLRKVIGEQHPLKSNRHYFVSKDKCSQYIENHKPKYSEAYVKELELKIHKLKSTIK